MICFKSVKIKKMKNLKSKKYYSDTSTVCLCKTVKTASVTIIVISCKVSLGCKVFIQLSTLGDVKGDNLLLKNDILHCIISFPKNNLHQIGE